MRQSASVTADKKPFHFGTKAESLRRVAPLLSLSHVPKFLVFTVQDWCSDAAAVLQQMASEFSNHRVAVRSSAIGEDAAQHSMAGVYDTVLNVAVANNTALAEAIDAVCAAMASDTNNQIIVQRMVLNPVMSGVLMTRDMANGAPYYVINYDDESGRTDTVTSGTRVNKTLYVFRGDTVRGVRSARVQTILKAVAEIEAVVDGPLDIEFALDGDNQFYLLQIRPMSAQPHWQETIPIANALHAEHQQLQVFFSQQNTIFGVMPDWNPAELIGQTPKALASSLFQQLITDSTWREARASMGYHNPENTRLMRMLLGHPFIDVRASFASLIPAALPQNLAARLQDVWLSRLKEHPECHDKVEFEVAQTVLDFTCDTQFDIKTNHSFSANEKAVILGALRDYTHAALTGDSLPLAQRALQQMRVQQLQRSIQQVPLLNEALPEARAGALHFAVIARHAFMAESLLRSAVARGAITPARAQELRAALPSITRDFQTALAALRAGADVQQFLEHYGHLRPGSFDVESPRYAERAQQLLREPAAIQTASPTFSWTQAEQHALEALLTEIGLAGITPEQMLAYLQQAIAGREMGKFIFSRSLSDVLEACAAWGEANGFTRADIAHLPLEYIEGDVAAARVAIAQARAAYDTARYVRLPPLITHPDDVYVAPLPRAMPNLFGKHNVRAIVKELTAQDDWAQSLDGVIVCIESADPGFDWVFGTGALGLVTKYGGANSHMAIRCMEMGLPAAIGCGEQLYARILHAGAVELNIEGRLVRPCFLT